MSDRIVFAAPVVAEGRRLRGSVKLMGERTRRNGEWLEIDPAAVQAADQTDIVGRWDHDPARILGRTANGTVRFMATDEGLSYEIDLPNTSYADDLLELANRGDIRGSSFEIEGIKSTFSTDLEDGSRVRRIHTIGRITDVSPVTNPAFLSSSLASFSKETEVSDPIESPAAEPAVPAAPLPEPRVSLSDDTFETTERFARTLDRASIEAAMDNLIVNGELKGDKLRQYEAYAKVYGEFNKVDDSERERAERMKLMHEIRLGRTPKAPVATDQFASEDYAEAFTQYLRTGNPRQVESFAQAIAGDGTQGGFTVPDGFLTRVSNRLKAFGGIAAISDEITTSTGESLRWPSNDDTANSAAIAAEGVAGAAGADLIFGNITLGAFSYSSNGTSNVPLKVSLELLQDSAFDIAAFVSDKLGERIGRKQASDLAIGAGTTLPFGLLSKTPDTMTATKTRAAAVEHHFQVDSAYRDLGNCRWVMSDTTLAKYWNATDLEGRPLFIPQAQSSVEGQPGAAGTLLGYPVTIDAAAANLVAFGDIRRGYIVRRVRGVEVLVNPYTSAGTRQVEYSAWARMDANIQDAFAYSVSDYASVTADAVA